MGFKSRLTSAVATCAFSCVSIGLIDSLHSPRAYSQFGRPITVAVKKVKDNAGASWFRKSYEEKLATMLSTELTNSGHFTVLAREDLSLIHI